MNDSDKLKNKQKIRHDKLQKRMTLLKSERLLFFFMMATQMMMMMKLINKQKI